MSGKLTFYGGWWIGGNGGVIHDLELDDKLLHQQTASITDSNEKEVGCVNGGSIRTIRLSCNSHVM